jgi:hypothetical protein
LWITNYPIYQSSSDSGNTFTEEEGAFVGGVGFHLMQDTADIVAVTSWGIWLFDRMSEARPGELSGFNTQHDLDHCSGWQSGAQYFFCYDDSHEVSYMVESLDYSNTFHQISETRDAEVISDVGLFKGYAPGVFYYCDIQHRLFVTEDWGNHWEYRHTFDYLPFGAPFVLNLYPGWEPGQMICFWLDMWNTTNPYPNNFRIVYTDDEGYTWTPMNFEVGVSEGERPEVSFFLPRVWPNPTNGTAQIQLPPGSRRVSLYNLLGQRVWGADQPPERLSLPAHTLPTGTYLLQADDAQTIKVQVVK